MPLTDEQARNRLIISLVEKLKLIQTVSFFISLSVLSFRTSTPPALNTVLVLSHKLLNGLGFYLLDLVYQSKSINYPSGVLALGCAYLGHCITSRPSRSGMANRPNPLRPPGGLSKGWSAGFGGGFMKFAMASRARAQARSQGQQVY